MENTHVHHRKSWGVMENTHAHHRDPGGCVPHSDMKLERVSAG